MYYYNYDIREHYAYFTVFKVITQLYISTAWGNKVDKVINQRGNGHDDIL